MRDKFFYFNVFAFKIMLLWSTVMQYFGNCQKAEKRADKENSGEDNFTKYKYGGRLEKLFE